MTTLDDSILTGLIFIAALLYWTVWVLLGAVVGPHVRDVLSPAYLRLIIVAIPVVFVVLLAARVVIARRRRQESGV